MDAASKVLIGGLCCAIGALSLPAAPEPAKCKGNNRLVGDCFRVHGRTTLGNGGPAIRIWRIVTDRKLGVWDDDGEKPEVRWLPEALAVRFDEDHTVFADFEVCPLKENEEELQIVCVESARKIVIRDERNGRITKGLL